MTWQTGSASDTIAALATPPGRGGVGIIRLSGNKVTDVAQAILGKLPSPRLAEYLPFYDDNQQVIDVGLAIFFPNPHSFTGEDVLELHGHGGPVIMDILLKEALKHSVRLALPGEFSQRAFLNDKIDLAQAEAIADLIEAGSEQAARSATRSLQGVFSSWVHSTVEQLIALRIYVEAAIDFPEEEIDFLADEHVTKELDYLVLEVERVIGIAHQGQLLREGVHVVLAGQPNTGKSSLLNALAGRESAIVTDIPGTTRDVLREEISIDGLPIHIIDTAGLRKSIDAVEQEGIRRAWQEIEQADCILLMIDACDGFSKAEQDILDQFPSHLPVTYVYNKIDLSEHQPHVLEKESQTEIWLSAKESRGISLLRDHLKNIVGYQNIGEGSFMARRRHLDALEKALEHVKKGQQQLKDHRAGELLAEDLRQAQNVLNEITGEFNNDDLLGRIFSSFCIGK